MSLLPKGHELPLFHSRMIRTVARGPGLRANGSFPKGARRLSEKSPGAHPPHRINPSPGGSASATPPQGGSDCPGSAGVPPRILCLWPPLSFSAMLQAATLSAGTAAARPKERHGAVPGWSKWGRWPRLCQALCGRDARAPRSHHPMTSSHQGHEIADAFWCRLSLKEIHLSSGLFVFIRVHLWFVFINDQRFFLE